MLRAVLPLAPSLLLAAFAAPAAAVPEPDAAERPGGASRIALAQLAIRQRVVIRVPRMPVQRALPPVPVHYKEGKGPRCVAANALAGAAINGEIVDLVLVGGTRLRARMDGDCAPLDFYSGFYLRPAADGQVCARRDAIRVRSGASCRINAFRKLTPAP